MKAEAQRIAIAQAEGFRRIGMIEGHTQLMGDLPPCRGWIEIPDYLNDLNAIHEAESMCLRSIHQMEEYRTVLKQVLTKANAVELDFCACASHRAEALLRKLGKWDDTL